MREIQRDELLIGIVVVCLILLGYFNLSPEPRTPEYTAEIKMQGDTIMVMSRSR